MPARLALYAFFARRKTHCPRKVENCGDCTDCFLDVSGIQHHQEELADLYRRLCGTRPVREMSDTGITRLSAENFNMYKSRIKNDLLARFGSHALRLLEIASVGKRPNTRYGLRMDKSAVKIIW